MMPCGANPQSIAIELEGSTDEDRKACGYDFVVAMDTVLAHRLGLAPSTGSGVVVSRRLTESTGPGKGKPLRVSAFLKLVPMPCPHHVRMDQTLRTALGIGFELGRHHRDDLSFSALKLDWKQALRKHVVRWLGVRYMYARVEKACPSDIEKNICRLANDALSILGTAEGSRIMVLACSPQSPGKATLRSLSIKAFDLSDAIHTEREQQKSTQSLELGWRARYVNSAELLGIKPDLLPIYLDAHSRNALDVDPGDPVKLRRNFPDLFKQQLLEVGVALALSLLALTRLFPEDLQKHNYWTFLGLTLAIAIITTCAVIFARLRAKVP